ncbi:MAG: hypothetical protein ABIH20_05795 [Candidatus Diapherotrites archaeon]
MEKNKVVEFSLNYRTLVEGHFQEVYRVDTAHGFLHEQCYWVSHKPISVAFIGRDLNDTYNFYFDKLQENFKRYKWYYLDKTQGDDEYGE